jgi:hypothetical protein
MPGIAVLCDGDFVVIGKVGGDKAILQSSQPSLMSALSSKPCGTASWC